MTKRTAIALGIALACVSAAPSLSEPITIRGLSWVQSKPEMLEMLSADGFKCGDMKDVFAAVFTGKSSDSDKVIGSTCEKDGASIEIFDNDEKIYFGCLTFNMCNFSNEEAAQSFVNNGKIESLSPELVPADKFTRREAYYRYCGSGNEGDRVCFEPDRVGTQFAILVFAKASFGKKIGFD